MHELWKSSIIGQSYLAPKNHQSIETRMAAVYQLSYSIYLLLFIHFFITSTDCIDDPGAYITGDVRINCGSNGVSAAGDGGKWIGDKHPRLISSLQLKGTSTIASVSGGDSVSDDQIAYKTARISRSAFSYTFLLRPGEKIIRLHFNPTTYKGFERRKDLFDVVAGPFTLLGNFSASLTSDALGLSYFTKEYCLNVEENQLLNISFTPLTSRSRDAYAFINGIEIIPVRLGQSYFHGGDVGARVIGHESQLFYIDNGTALETVHREKVRWDSASSDDDFSDIFGTWGTVPKEKARVLAWKIPVDVGFRYLVRLQFSNRGLNMIENGTLIFKVLINEIVACTNVDIFQERESTVFLKHNHMDFIVIMRGRKEEGKRDLSVQSCDEFVDDHGPFTGFEISKLSNLDNSLDGPNSLPSTWDSPSWTIQSLLSIIAHRNVIPTLAIATIFFLATINAHRLRRILKSDNTEEENKPSVRADRFCRRFSLTEIQMGTRDFSDALVIGKGGYGKVYKCLIDGGRDTVAIKRLKSNSKQGAPEFLTEIETLSELRHVNLVSLIGYCNEHHEMILVYSYMPNGTLADHLYKLERSGNKCSLTWKQLLDICIGAGRGLDYLHTGHGVIHRDVKVSNILLDENYTAKISDFGLVKHENRDNIQKHATTKVKGTFGYFDPIYLSTGKLTRKSDVYAFGVVLLEVLCGRPALDQSVPMDEQILTKWARDKINKGEVDLIVASSLRGKILLDSLKTFVQVVERCLDDEPNKRPTMAQVVMQLEVSLEHQEITRTCVAPRHDEANILVSGQRTSSSPDDQTITSHPREQTRSNNGAHVLVHGPLSLPSPSEQTITPHPREQTSHNDESNVIASMQLTSSSTGEQTMTAHGRVRTNHNDETNVFRSWELTMSTPNMTSVRPPRARSTRNMDNDYQSSEGNRRNVPSYRSSLHRSWNAFMNRFKSSKKKKLSTSARSPEFDWNTIAFATNQFAPSFEIGRGGFGSVYKVVLPSGEIIAAKRLSAHSAQGYIAYENEIRALQNLQHRNIIKLLGYCTNGEERLLVYEFMENGGLDAFIFDEARRIQLQWNHRFKIINGIAQGLRYLHRDSGSRIIHRDPKPSNILLDSEMNPKISDFGLARYLGEDRSHVTTAIAGTLGYIAPESAMDGTFSTVTDVYTFGISVLEIVSGKRNVDLRGDREDAPIFGFGWRPWEDGKILSLADKSIQVNVDEALRCIQVGILCTREAHERPTMSDVVDMLDGKISLP